MKSTDDEAERERLYTRQAFRAAHIMIARFGGAAYDEACRRFLKAWHARTDEPGDEVAWWYVAEAIRSLDALGHEARC